MNTLDLFFEWDSSKERINIQKHRIDFRTASQVFLDPMRIERFDEDHSKDEERYLTIGCVNDRVCILSVIYTERKNKIRIISARYANAEERESYYEYCLL